MKNWVHLFRFLLHDAVRLWMTMVNSRYQGTEILNFELKSNSKNQINYILCIKVGWFDIDIYLNSSFGFKSHILNIDMSGIVQDYDLNDSQNYVLESLLKSKFYDSLLRLISDNHRAFIFFNSEPLSTLDIFNDKYWFSNMSLQDLIVYSKASFYFTIIRKFTINHYHQVGKDDRYSVDVEVFKGILVNYNNNLNRFRDEYIEELFLFEIPPKQTTYLNHIPGSDKVSYSVESYYYDGKITTDKIKYGLYDKESHRQYVFGMNKMNKRI